MLIIRLSRTGRKNLPTFNIVVTEKTHAATSGRFHEKLGYYDNLKDPAVVNINKDRLDHWLKKGAQISETVARLLKKEGVEGMEKYYDAQKKYNKKSKNPDKEEAPAEGGGEESAAPEEGEASSEAPVEEVPQKKAEESSE